MNLAIIIGVEKYNLDLFDDLPACKNDANVIHAVINNVKEINDSLLINKNESGYEVKRKISDFVEKHKSNDVNELIFYFSGHGERYEDDFLYLLSDFDRSKKERTGLRNTELDNWIKTLSPNLCIKIVDSCFSGTQYIKSESNTEIELKNSAQKFGLKNIYFWFSSRENQASYAGNEFSKFTESILTSLTELEGEVRYRDIMAAVADDFSSSTNSKPIFITQSDNIEKFGLVTKETHKIILDAFGMQQDQDINSSESISQTEESHSSSAAVEKLSIFQMVTLKSNTECFSEEKLLKFIDDYNKTMQSWDDEINSIYKIDCKVSENNRISNAREIGKWLEKNESLNLFAEADYSNRTYEVEEYRALPKKPISANFERIRKYGLGLNLGLGLDGEQTEYKLEKIQKNERFVDGFSYSHQAENRILQLSFIPKVELVEPISFYSVPIYSNTNLFMHTSIETLKRHDWKYFSHPRCLNWNILKFKLSSEAPGTGVANYIKKDIKKWIEDLLSKHKE